MGFVKGSLPACPRNQHCSQWIQTYIKYCLCNMKDGVSLTLGFLSVISWGVAEVPQIITNYKEKSTEGISIAFLMTWIVGDLFNLFGCMLEPATLPTQYYMAVLYTITTVILTSQTIYYSYICHRLKASRRGLPNKDSNFHQSVTDGKEKHANVVREKQVKLGESLTNGHNIVEGIPPSSPIPVAAPLLPRYGSLGRDLYYMSARSLSKSRTPTAGSYLARSCDRERITHVPIHNTHSVEEPLLGDLVSTQSAPPVNTKSMLCAISAVTFILSNFNLHHSMNSRLDMVLEKPPQGVVIRVGRKLFQNNGVQLLRHGSEGSSGIGTFLGWAMAAIYMGGRLPQIFLNIRRGNVEGLNPLMFMFAVVGNVTYVASILVSSLDWSKITPNLPWLVDAGGCVLLDTFILTQFIYFHYWKPQDPKNRHGDFSLQA